MQEDWDWYICGALVPELREPALAALEAAGRADITDWSVGLVELGQTGDPTWWGSWGQTSSWGPELFVTLSLGLDPDGVVTRDSEGRAKAFDGAGIWWRARVRDRAFPHVNAQWAQAVLFDMGLETWSESDGE